MTADDRALWFRIIVELEKSIPLRTIASKTGSSITALCRYKTGVNEPRYSVGQKLLALHKYRETLTVICSDNGLPPEAE